MDLVVRQSTLDDLPRMLHICRHPLVTPHQYRLTSNWEELFRRQIGGDCILKGVEYGYDSIEHERILVGYIIHCHSKVNGNRVAVLGWNLHPDYWGKGIMPAAVSTFMDRCAFQRETRIFVAECFRQNTRCKRVLMKLGFVKFPLPWFARAVNAVKQQCLHWIEHFELDYANRP